VDRPKWTALRNPHAPRRFIRAFFQDWSKLFCRTWLFSVCRIAHLEVPFEPRKLETARFKSFYDLYNPQSQVGSWSLRQRPSPDRTSLLRAACVSGALKLGTVGIREMPDEATVVGLSGVSHAMHPQHPPMVLGYFKLAFSVCGS